MSCHNRLEYLSFQFSSGLISQFVNTCTFEDSIDFVEFADQVFFFFKYLYQMFFLAEIERPRCRPQQTQIPQQWQTI